MKPYLIISSLNETHVRGFADRWLRTVLGENTSPVANMVRQKPRFAALERPSSVKT